MNIIQKIFKYVGAITTGKSVGEESSSYPEEITISITTETKYIMCRAWEWHETAESEIESLKKDLLILKVVAQRDQKEPLFCSKYSLPDDLKLWLIHHEIPFEQG